jgi:hypothetical protein
VVNSNSPNLNISLVMLTGGIIDVDEYVRTDGDGVAALDPVLIPLNPNDILVSAAPINPNPNAPLFTSSQIAAMTAAGIDLSGLESVGLIAPSAVPEPRTLPIIAVGVGVLLILQTRRTRALPPG